MKKTLTVIVALTTVCTTWAQDFKIKKDEILIEKQVVAKIKKEKEGFKISSLDGESTFTINAINVTATNQIAPKYWLQLTGANGNVREAEYGEMSFTFSKEKWNISALLKSELGLLTPSGVDKQKVNEYFQKTDRSVSDKWDKFIKEQADVIAKEDQLALDQKLTIDGGGNIKKNNEKIAYLKKETVDTQVPSYKYEVYTVNNVRVASIFFYQQENLNKSNGFIVKLSDKEQTELYGVVHSFNKIDFDSLIKRMVYKLNAMELLN